VSGSIRRRVGLIVVAAIAPVLAGGAYLSYRHTADAVRGRFDSDLAATARVLADLAEYDEEGYELEIAPSTARLLDGDEAVRVEAWRPDGKRLYRSPSLGDADLPQPGPAVGAVSVAGGELPGGGDARVATLRFVPRSDVDAGDGGRAAPMALSVARSTAGMDSMLARLALWFGGVGAALVLVCAWLVSRATGIGLRPLSRMAGEIAAIDAGALDRRLPAGDAPAEVRPVVDKLNELLARLEESFSRERRFTADAAHELRTPLAVLRTEVEVALGAERQAADYREVLSGTLTTIEDASRIVDALLLLARADVGRLRARSEPVDLGELIATAWDRSRPVADGRDLRFDAELSDGATVDADPDLMRTIATNLLGNAARHASEGGQVHVRAAPERGLILEVENSASELQPGDVDKMFDRFWRRDDARTDSGHSGLGLAVVRAAAGALDMTLEASLHDGRLAMTLSRESAS